MFVYHGLKEEDEKFFETVKKEYDDFNRGAGTRS